MTSEDLFAAFDEDPFLHFLAPGRVTAAAGSKKIAFQIRDGSGNLVGVDPLAPYSARIAHRPQPTVGPALPEPPGVGKALATHITKQIVRSAFDDLNFRSDLNSIRSSVSLSPGTGVQSGVDRALTPAYRNLSVPTTGEFGYSSLLAVRSAMHRCDRRAQGRSMQLVVSSPETYDSLMKTMDSRELVFACEFRDGHQVYTALCFGGAFWIPVPSYRDHATVRVLSLDDVTLHVGDAWTSGGLILPETSHTTQFTVATADIQVAFPRLSTHAAVGGWLLK